MLLKDAITRINYDQSIGIYATAPFSSNSDCRYGDRQFENGGLLDAKVFAINGEQANERISAFDDSVKDIVADDSDLNAARDIWIAEQLIPELEETRQELDALHLVVNAFTRRK